MSIFISAMVWRTPLPAGTKLVALALADMANDEGNCWPSVSSLVGRTGFSERAVQGHISALAEAGLLLRHERPGRSTVYTVCPTPAESAPPQNLRPAESAPTPAESAPRSIKETSIPSIRAKQSRGSRWKSGQQVPAEWIVWARDKTGWSAATVAHIAEEFATYWPGRAGHLGLKLDWQSTWQNWVLKELKREKGFGPDKPPRPRKHSNRDAIAEFLKGEPA